MTRTIEVEIDSAGNVHPVDPAPPNPKSALLVLQTGANETMLLSEAALATVWLRPEEDEAWDQLVTAEAIKSPEQKIDWRKFFSHRAGTVSQKIAVQSSVESRGDQ